MVRVPMTGMRVGVLKLLVVQAERLQVCCCWGIAWVKTRQLWLTGMRMIVLVIWMVAVVHHVLLMCTRLGNLLVHGMQAGLLRKVLVLLVPMPVTMPPETR